MKPSIVRWERIRLWTAVSGVVLLSLLGGLSPAANVVEPTLTFLSLTCDTPTSEGTDRIELRVYSPSHEIFKQQRVMTRGQVWNLENRKVKLTHDVRPELWEIDPEIFAEDDWAASMLLIRAGDKAGVFEHQWKFLPGTYTLRYRIDRPPLVSAKRHELLRGKLKRSGLDTSAAHALPGVEFGGNASTKRQVKSLIRIRNVTVELDTNVFDAPDGNDTGVVLEAGTKGVTRWQRIGDWYHVKWPAGKGWVWSGPGHASIKVL